MPLTHNCCPADGLKQSIEFFVKDVLDRLSKDEAYASLGLMVAAASLIREHTEIQRPVHRGLTRPRRGNLKRDREGCHYRQYRDYFHPTKPLFIEALFR
jgi:hypothetical protein